MKGGTGLLQTAVTYRALIISTAEYLNTKYNEDQCINVIKSLESNEPNTYQEGCSRIKPNK